MQGAVRALGEAWRLKYFQIKYEFMASKLIVAQALARSILAAERFKHLQNCEQAGLMIQTSWRKRDLSRKWMAVAKAVVEHRATEYLEILAESTASGASTHMAVAVLGGRLQEKLLQLRRRIRIQRHFKGFLARRHFQRTQISLRNTALAVSNVANFYAMQARCLCLCFVLLSSVGKRANQIFVSPFLHFATFVERCSFADCFSISILIGCGFPCDAFSRTSGSISASCCSLSHVFKPSFEV